MTTKHQQSTMSTYTNHKKKKLKVSIIVAVYKDVRALELIIDALKTQTYKNFELIVAEDGNSTEINEYLSTVSDIDFKHTTQNDTGIRKSRSQNNAIITSTGEYLIFIDGDCIPYKRFIEGHVKLSKMHTVITGRRVNLGEKTSTAIRNGALTPKQLENSFINRIPLLHMDKSSHIEQGICFSPNGFLYKKLLSKRKRTTDILGCNFSCHKEDIISINGFDESYEGTALGDDTDIQWRFVANGMSLKGCHNIANIFHLHHTREHRIVDYSAVIEIMKQRQKNNEFFCVHGISSHEILNHAQ